MATLAVGPKGAMMNVVHGVARVARSGEGGSAANGPFVAGLALQVGVRAVERKLRLAIMIEHP